jgi:phage shock protein C
MTSQRLYRLPSKAMIGGVCAGLAEYFKIDPSIIRVIFVLGTFAKGIFLLLYLLLWVALPTSSDVSTFSVSSTDSTLTPSNIMETRKQNSNFLGGIILVVVGFIFLFDEFDLFWWFRFDKLWPIIPIIIGLYILFKDKVNPPAKPNEE